MVDAKWGRKHVCLGCQAAFYDMRRDPIACPKCGVVHQPVALLKSDGRPPRRRRLPSISTADESAEPGKQPGASGAKGPASDDDDAAAAPDSDEDAELIVADEDDDEELEPDEAGEAKG